MKKLLAIIAMTCMSMACTDTLSNQDNTTTPDNAVSSYYISPEDALKDLQAFLKNFETTRSVSEKDIASIEIVMSNNISADTRSVSTTDTPLLYIFNFQDNQGAAIMGADTRISGLLALTDYGSFHASDFDLPLAMTKSTAISDAYNSGDMIFHAVQTEEELRKFIGGEMKLFALLELHDAGQMTKATPIDSVRFNYDGKTWRTEERIHPLVRTLWHQYSPFNDNLSERKGKTVLAGCVTIAIAQIMAYHMYPQMVNAYEAWPWPLIRNVQSFYSGSHTSGDAEGKYWASFLCGEIGEEACWQFSNTGTSGSDSAAKKEFERMGYGPATVIRTDKAKIQSSVYKMLRNQCPVYYSGNSAPFNGHAFILNGLWRIYNEANPSKKMDLVHINYGWRGQCNGWYRYGTFDTSQRIAYTPDVGDDTKENTIRENYYYDHHMIVYTKP